MRTDSATGKRPERKKPVAECDVESERRYYGSRGPSRRTKGAQCWADYAGTKGAARRGGREDDKKWNNGEMTVHQTKQSLESLWILLFIIFLFGNGKPDDSRTRERVC